MKKNIQILSLIIFLANINMVFGQLMNPPTPIELGAINAVGYPDHLLTVEVKPNPSLVVLSNGKSLAIIEVTGFNLNKIDSLSWTYDKNGTPYIVTNDKFTKISTPAYLPEKGYYSVTYQVDLSQVPEYSPSNFQKNIIKRGTLLIKAKSVERYNAIQYFESTGDIVTASTCNEKDIISNKSSKNPTERLFFKTDSCVVAYDVNAKEIYKRWVYKIPTSNRVDFVTVGKENVYVPSLNLGLVALDKLTGKKQWNNLDGSLKQATSAKGISNVVYADRNGEGNRVFFVSLHNDQSSSSVKKLRTVVAIKDLGNSYQDIWVEKLSDATAKGNDLIDSTVSLYRNSFGTVYVDYLELKDFKQTVYWPKAVYSYTYTRKKIALKGGNQVKDGDRVMWTFSQQKNANASAASQYHDLHKHPRFINTMNSKTSTQNVTVYQDNTTFVAAQSTTTIPNITTGHAMVGKTSSDDRQIFITTGKNDISIARLKVNVDNGIINSSNSTKTPVTDYCYKITPSVINEGILTFGCSDKGKNSITSIDVYDTDQPDTKRYSSSNSKLAKIDIDANKTYLEQSIIAQHAVFLFSRDSIYGIPLPVSTNSSIAWGNRGRNKDRTFNSWTGKTIVSGLEDKYFEGDTVHLLVDDELIDKKETKILYVYQNDVLYKTLTNYVFQKNNSIMAFYDNNLNLDIFENYNFELVINNKRKWLSPPVKSQIDLLDDFLIGLCNTYPEKTSDGFKNTHLWGDANAICVNRMTNNIKLTVNNIGTGKKYPPFTNTNGKITEWAFPGYAFFEEPGLEFPVGLSSFRDLKTLKIANVFSAVANETKYGKIDSRMPHDIRSLKKIQSFSTWNDFPSSNNGFYGTINLPNDPNGTRRTIFDRWKNLTSFNINNNPKLRGNFKETAFCQNNNNTVKVTKTLIIDCNGKCGADSKTWVDKLQSKKSASEITLCDDYMNNEKPTP